MIAFRSGTNGLNEELERHRGNKSKKPAGRLSRTIHTTQVKMTIGRVTYVWEDECESVVHGLRECPVYDPIRNTFMGEVYNLLGGSFEEFSALNN